jgi:hypothetical protein
MFGGFRKYVIQRWFIQNHYRKFWRVAWLPVLISYGIGCYGMRKYDNAAYNFSTSQIEITKMINMNICSYNK